MTLFVWMHHQSRLTAYLSWHDNRLRTTYFLLGGEKRRSYEKIFSFWVPRHIVDFVECLCPRLLSFPTLYIRLIRSEGSKLGESVGRVTLCFHCLGEKATSISCPVFSDAVIFILWRGWFTARILLRPPLSKQTPSHPPPQTIAPPSPRRT